MGLAQSARTTLQFVDGVPFWSKRMYNYRKWMRNALKEKFGIEEVLPDLGNALFNSTSNRIFAGEEFWIRTKSGELISSRTLLKDAIDSGVMDSYANAELKGALTKIGSQTEWDKFKALDGWREDISELASYVQQRQRFNLYVDLRRQGKTSEEAARLTLRALYDWKNGISLAEAQYISSWVPFYRFWRLALTQHGRKIMEPAVKPTFGKGGQLRKALRGETSAARIRQQYIALHELGSFIDPTTLEEHQEIQSQMDDLVKRGIIGPGWLGPARGLFNTQRASKVVADSHEETRGYAQTITHTASATGPFTAVETAELGASYLNLIGAAYIDMFPAVVVGAAPAGIEALQYMDPERAVRSWEEYERLGNMWKDSLNPTYSKFAYDPVIEMIGPVHKEIVKAALSKLEMGGSAGYNPTHLRLRPLEKKMVDSGHLLGWFITPDDLKVGEDGKQSAAAVQLFLWRFLGHTPWLAMAGEGMDLAEKVHNPEMQEFLKSPDMDNFIRGMGYFMGQHTGVSQRYPISAPPFPMGTGETFIPIGPEKSGALRYLDAAHQAVTKSLEEEKENQMERIERRANQERRQEAKRMKERMEEGEEE